MENDPAFATTQWSVVVRAGRGSSPSAALALEALCSTYWYPLYAFVRRRGYTAEDAQDATQEFFTRMLDKSWLESADPERGRFRAFLLTMFKRFLSNERDHANALKRGGGVPNVSLDQARFDFESGERRYSIEPFDDQTPERLFERRWALTLLDRVMSRLGDEYNAGGKQDFFHLCRFRLTAGSRVSKNQSRAIDNREPNATIDHISDGPDRVARESTEHFRIAEALGINSNALSVAIHRMKQRYRLLLIEEIRQTLADPDDPAELQQELNQLRSVLG